jgi:hypothetical protein
VSWFPTLHAALLLASTGLAAWAAVVARGRRTMPGSAAFGWLMLATAYWALLSALHVLVISYDVRIRISQLQYVGISAVAPLWLMFTSQYARARWLGDRWLTALVWVIPAVTVAMAFSNDWHHLIWTEIVPVNDGLRLVYRHGPWFWVAVIYGYFAMATGTLLLFRALRHIAARRPSSSPERCCRGWGTSRISGGCCLLAWTSRRWASPRRVSRCSGASTATAFWAWSPSRAISSSTAWTTASSCSIPNGTSSISIRAPSG